MGVKVYRNRNRTALGAAVDQPRFSTMPSAMSVEALRRTVDQDVALQSANGLPSAQAVNQRCLSRPARAWRGGGGEVG